MQKVFVTGVNGLLGTNLTRMLLRQGFFVIGLVREKSRYKGNTSVNLQLIEGELFDDFTKVLSHVDIVIHVAALTSQSILDYAEYRRINCSATIQLFCAAVQCKVKRFVFVSTANTLEHGSLENPGTENQTARKPFTESLYALSKREAEQYLLSRKHLMDTIIVNPTFMLGAYDTKPSSGRIILAGWNKKVVFYPPGGKNFVHVADVAQGIINCIERGRNGEKYLLAHENLTYKEFFTKLNVIANQRPFMIKLPGSLLIMIGFLGELLRHLRIRTNLGIVNMRILCTGNYYSPKKSKQELGVHFRPIDLAITDALNYFKKGKVR